jgi:hypothetical protein
MCVFLLVVFAAPQQETTLASPRRTSRKPHPGPAALGSLRSPSLRRPRMGRSGREEPNYRRNFTPPEKAEHGVQDVQEKDSQKKKLFYHPMSCFHILQMKLYYNLFKKHVNIR